MGTVKVKSGSNEGKVQYPYDAMVYIDGTVVCAVDKEGNTIKRGVAGTDDAAVIQSAIDSFPDVSGGGGSFNKNVGTIYIDSGQYTINNTIDISKTSDFRLNLNFCGSRGYTVFDGTSLVGNPIIRVSTSVPNIRNWSISGITFTAGNTVGVDGIRVLNGDYFHIKDCIFKEIGSTAYGIYFVGGYGIIEGCLFYHCDGSGIYANATGIIISSNVIGEDIGEYGIYLYRSNDCSIIGNSIHGFSSTSARTMFVVGNGSTLGINNVILGNSVKDVSRGIHLSSAPYNTISNNILVGSGTTGNSYYAAIPFDSCSGLTITGNDISNWYRSINGFGTDSIGTLVANNRFNNVSGFVGGILYPIVHNNIGYVHISEIRDALDNTLEKLGDVRLLCPCAEYYGTSITDYTRNSNTLTAQASVATWYGFQGRATYYNFDGTAKYLYRANDTDFDFGDSAVDQAFSIVACVYADNVASRQIIGKWDANNAREWRLFLDASGYPTIQLYDESIDKYIGRQDQTALVTTGWKVLIATYDGSTICGGCKIYLDGVQVDDADYTDAGYVAMEAVTANLMVGALKNAAVYSEYFDGKMTWIGVAAKELSADEAWSITQRLKGVLGI